MCTLSTLTLDTTLLLTLPPLALATAMHILAANNYSALNHPLAALLDPDPSMAPLSSHLGKQEGRKKQSEATESL